MGLFSPFLCHFYWHFAVFDYGFGSWPNSKQNDARKGKKMQISPKFTKIMQNSTKTSFFPPAHKTCFCLKKRRKSIVWGTHFSSNPPGRFEGVGDFPFGVPFSFGVRPKKKARWVPQNPPSFLGVLRASGIRSLLAKLSGCCISVWS